MSEGVGIGPRVAEAAEVIENPAGSKPEVDALTTAETTEHESGVSKDRQTQEVRSLATGLLGMTAESIQTELSAAPTAEQRQQVLQNQGKRKLDDYNFLLTVDPGLYPEDRRLSLDHGQPVSITQDGKRFTILQIKDGTKDKFTCVIQGENGKTFDQVLDRSVVALAQLISERDTITDLFTGDEKEMLSAYFEYMQTGNLPPIDNIDQKIQQFAQTHGLMTAESMRTNIATSDMANKDELLKILNGTNVIDQQVLEKLNEAGVPTSLFPEIGLLADNLGEGQFREALSAGTLPELIRKFSDSLQINENDSPEEKERKRKELEKAKSILATSGGIIALLLLSIIEGMIESAAHIK